MSRARMIFDCGRTWLFEIELFEEQEHDDTMYEWVKSAMAHYVECIKMAEHEEEPEAMQVSVTIPGLQPEPQFSWDWPTVRDSDDIDESIGAILADCLMAVRERVPSAEEKKA